MGKRFKSLNILFLAFLAGQVIMSAIFSYLVLQEKQNTSDALFGMFVPFVIVAAVGLSYFIYNKRKVEGADLDDGEEKINHYFQTSILRMALLEGPILMILTFMFLDGDLNYLIYVGIGIVAFIYFRPGQPQFISDYEVSMEEQNEIESKN